MLEENFSYIMTTTTSSDTPKTFTLPVWTQIMGIIATAIIAAVVLTTSISSTLHSIIQEEIQAGVAPLEMRVAILEAKFDEFDQRLTRIEDAQQKILERLQK